MNDDSFDAWESSRELTRRRAMYVLSVGATTAFAGCLGGDTASKPAPIDLSGGKEDDQGGMVIGVHAGPNGQIFYRDEQPSGHDNPAWFHTLSMGLFPYYFEHRRMGWEADAVYVTDYSTVDYDLTTDGERTFISTHTAADTFGDATEMSYVVESTVYGGMGKDLIPFSVRDDAEAFVDEHGGSTITFDDVTREWLSGYMRS
jgi:nitrous oxide reductase accessory protein NosL